jgi:cellulose synthase/poly-beta-1,6-N-acetylglucosamine synthase-like glycosyltransferase
MKSITIGIPSYNEEKSIINLLHSLSLQYLMDYTISETIISDDSNDSTPQLVESFTKKNSQLNINLIHHDERRGAAAAWNEIFNRSTGDVVVLYDADILINKDTTAQLVSFLKKGTGLCASNPQPIQRKSISGRASSFIAYWLRAVRNQGLSQYTVMGRALSLTSEVAKKIHIPGDIIAVDLYLQCKVLDLGLDIVYNDDALVYFLPANKLLDFSSQVIRAAIGHKQINAYYSKFKINLPLRIALIEAVHNVIHDPIGALSVMICYAVLPYYKLKIKQTRSAKWHTADSTKAFNYRVKL